MTVDRRAGLRRPWHSGTGQLPYNPPVGSTDGIMPPSLIIDVIASLLLGSMVFFAAVVAPAAFRSLDDGNAGAFLRMLFPRYYLWGIVLSLACLGVSLVHSPKSAALMTLVLAGFAYARQLLVPAINDARNQWRETDDPGDKARFNALHRRSVIINVAQMAMLAVIIVA